MRDPSKKQTQVDKTTIGQVNNITERFKNHNWCEVTRGRISCTYLRGAGKGAYNLIPKNRKIYQKDGGNLLQQEDGSND